MSVVSDDLMERLNNLFDSVQLALVENNRVSIQRSNERNRAWFEWMFPDGCDRADIWYYGGEGYEQTGRPVHLDIEDWEKDTPKAWLIYDVKAEMYAGELWAKKKYLGSYGLRSASSFNPPPRGGDEEALARKRGLDYNTIEWVYERTPRGERELDHPPTWSQEMELGFAEYNGIIPAQ